MHLEDSSSSSSLDVAVGLIQIIPRILCYFYYFLNHYAGKQISLISKKNIRYLGTLYSINEQNATVALQNVRSFGTEGRPGAEVPPSNDMHPFLVFRGQDITDLHVHEEAAESTTATATPNPAPATTTTTAPPEASSKPAPAPATTEKTPASAVNSTAPAAAVVSPPAAPAASKESSKENEPKRGGGGGRGGGGRGAGGRNMNNNRRPRAAPGTGASLLNRPTRGAVTDNTESLQDDFDFQTNLKEFDEPDEEEDDAGDEPPASYEKDDFFDSISCEATDRQAGVENRLRGRVERDLNTETFGAVALSQRRRKGGRGGGRGGRGGRGGGNGGNGGGGGRGGGRGRSGRGRGRGGRGRGGSQREEGRPGREVPAWS